MDKSKSYALCGTPIALAAIFAVVRGDTAFAAPMFFVAVFFARRAHQEWKRENV